MSGHPSRAPKSDAVQEVEVANANWPTVALVPSGDGRALARALVAVLVRRALMTEGLTAPASNDEGTAP